jgi:fucose 4-O-acetylase-like acetyltransferase
MVGWDFSTDQVHKFFVTYHMPVFFMISGFFFSSSLKLSFKEVLWRRFTVLIIPHITWNIIIGLVDWGMTFASWNTPFNNKSFTFFSQLQAFFTPNPLTELWFFKDLFLVDLIVFTSCRIFKKRYVAFIGSMLFVLLFGFFGVIGKTQRFLMPIFWTGMLLKAYYPIFCKHLNKILIISGISFLVCFYFYDTTYMIYARDFPPLINFQQSLAEGKIVFNFTNIGISGLRSLTGIVGSIFFFTLFQRFWKKNTVTSFLSHCGQVTVGIYVIQIIVLQKIMHNTVNFANVNIWIYRLIITPITAALVLGICVLIIKLIQRNKRLAFILFGSSVIDHGFVDSENQRQTSTHLA